MSIHEKLLEKWHQCRERRYPILVIVKAPLDTLFTGALIEEFASITQAKVLNFQERYKGRLDLFFTWQSIRDELYDAANSNPVIATELEPIYAKWPIVERMAFLRNLLRSSPQYPIILTINCQEDLSELQAIEKNSRGMIWAPSK
jgi:hypothetical protein